MRGRAPVIFAMSGSGSAMAMPRGANLAARLARSGRVCLPSLALARGWVETRRPAAWLAGRVSCLGMFSSRASPALFYRHGEALVSCVRELAERPQIFRSATLARLEAAIFQYSRCSGIGAVGMEASVVCLDSTTMRRRSIADCADFIVGCVTAVMTVSAPVGRLAHGSAPSSRRSPVQARDERHATLLP